VVVAAEVEGGFSLRTTSSRVAEVSRVDYVKVLVFTSDEVGSADPDEEGSPIGTGTTVAP